MRAQNNRMVFFKAADQLTHLDHQPLFYELAENRMPLLGMEKKTGSLEDIFLQLTDKPGEETKQ